MSKCDVLQRWPILGGDEFTALLDSRKQGLHGKQAQDIDGNPVRLDRTQTLPERPPVPLRPHLAEQ